jgi:NTE family protein
MAKAGASVKATTKKTTKAKAQTVLVLQGGGALGSYQGGVYESLSKHGFDVDWVVGTSIGAINGALIAGNRPEHRLDRLRAFWQRVGRDAPEIFPFFGSPEWLRPWNNASRVWDTLSNGIPGFFTPRPGSSWNINQRGFTNQASFYDTSPLEETLNDLVDFKYLNTRAVRFTVSAVDIATGELKTFDNEHDTIRAQHIMASGALPPGFPPVEIDGNTYWDGGIYSNTPIDIVLHDAERRDTLCFMVDLWDPTETVPTSIAEAITRQKDIQYSSRSTEHLEDHEHMQNLRRAIQLLAHRLPAKERNSPEVKRLTALGCASTIDIIRLIMKARPEDDQNKDIDFARATIETRWKAGAHDGKRALARKSWLKAPPPHIGMVVHELEQE